MKRRMIVLALAALGVSSAWGQQTAPANNWYAGASVGWSNVDESGLDDDSTGFKLYGGYRFNQWLNAEAGYTNLGEFDDGGTLEAHGAFLSALGRFPVATNLDVFGKAGIYAWDSSGDDLAFADDTGVDPLLGVGGTFYVNQQFGIRAEYERHYDVDDADIDLLSAGVTYDF